MAPSVKRLTLDLGSGGDLTVREFEPRIGLWADSTEPTRGSLSVSLSPSALTPLMLSLSISLSKINNFF